MRPRKPALLALMVAAGCAGGNGPRAAAPAAEVLEQPGAAASTTFQPPQVIERRLNNGIRVLIVEQRDLPIVRIALALKRGAADAAPAVASYARAAMLRPKGIAGMAAASWFGHDAMGVSAVGVTQIFRGSNMAEQSFAALSQMLRDPDLSADAVEKERKRRQSISPPGSQNDGALLARLQHELLYPPEHPYRHLADGDAKSASGVDADDVRRFFAEHVQPDQVVAIAVGDVARESFVDSIGYALGSWQGRAVPQRALPEPIAAPLGGTPITLIDHPRLGQSQLVVAARGVPSSSRDFEPLFLLNAVLGGSFLGRLNLNLREQHAYTYGSYSNLGAWRGAGPFVAKSAVAQQHTAEAIRQIIAEIERLRHEPLDRDELERVKRAAIRRIPLMFRSLDSTLSAVIDLAIYDRPVDDYAALPSRIERVTPTDIVRVAREYLAPEKLRWFVVGDAAAIRQPLTDVGLGAVHVVASTGAQASQ